MRILVTGSRTWRDAAAIATALDEAVAGRTGPHTLVHGAARGADVIAAAHAARRGWQVEAHPADWSRCDGPDCRPAHRRCNGHREYCPTAGHRRNARMIATGADVCLAFILNRSPGATSCWAKARAAGIPVVRQQVTS
jgi:hypothetical protein